MWRSWGVWRGWVRFSSKMSGDRVAYLTLAGGCLATVGIARLLEPNAAGYGTHRQLGLPPCLFRAVTGLPCPSCGMTTCFAYAARLDWSRAWITQPFGLILFCGFLVAAPALLFLAWRGTPLETAARSVTRTGYLLAFLACYLAGWSWKLILG